MQPLHAMHLTYDPASQHAHFLPLPRPLRASRAASRPPLVSFCSSRRVLYNTIPYVITLASKTKTNSTHTVTSRISEFSPRRPRAILSHTANPRRSRSSGLRLLDLVSLAPVHYHSYAMGEDEAVLGPITLSDYDADRRWKLRDKCLRVATFYRVMHMRERSRKAACMRRIL